MGVHGLPAELKAATGIVSARMSGKEFHVDMNGTYFGLMKSRAYSAVVKHTTKLVRDAESMVSTSYPKDLQADFFGRANMLGDLRNKLSVVTNDPDCPDSVLINKTGLLQDDTNPQRTMVMSLLNMEFIRCPLAIIYLNTINNLKFAMSSFTWDSSLAT
jgi:hypothetical protein